MTAANHNLVIEAGATWQQTVIWNTTADVAHDMTDYDVRFQVRDKFSDAAALVDLTEIAGITVTAIDGQMDIEITATATDALTWEHGVYTLDVEDVAGTGKFTRLMQGKITVSPTAIS